MRKPCLAYARRTNVPEELMPEELMLVTIICNQSSDHIWQCSSHSLLCYFSTSRVQTIVLHYLLF